MSEAQPVEVMYPSPVTRQPSINSDSHSNGSFGPVFIVLAVIVVISAVACVLGRLCSRRLSRVKEAGHHHSNKANKYNQQEKSSSHGLGPKEWETRQKPSFNMSNGDIEFGFDKKKASGAKMGVKSGGKGKPIHYQNGGHGNGHGHGHKPEVRFADNV